MNTTNGFVWMHRSAPADPLAENMDTPEIAYGKMTSMARTRPFRVS